MVSLSVNKIIREQDFRQIRWLSWHASRQQLDLPKIEGGARLPLQNQVANSLSDTTHWKQILCADYLSEIAISPLSRHVAISPVDCLFGRHQPSEALNKADQPSQKYSLGRMGWRSGRVWKMRRTRNMPIPMGIIPPRKVGTEMDAARFLSLTGGSDHQSSDGQQVLQFPTGA
jgi:hypothetical protein